MKDQILSRIEERLESLGISAAAAAVKAGLGADFIRDMRRGRKASGSGEALGKLAAALECDVTWLLTGTTDSREARKAPTSGQKVPEIDIRAGMGGGGMLAVHDESNGLGYPEGSVGDEWGLPDGFVRHVMRARAKDMVILPVIGDSMMNPERPWQAGTFLPGDRVIVDRMRNQPSPPGAFAVYDGIGVVIKIVSPVMGADPPRLRLASQNPLYGPYEVLSEEAGIIGRVVGRITAF